MDPGVPGGVPEARCARGPSNKGARLQAAPPMTHGVGTKPYEFIRFGAMDVTKPYEFIGFGAIKVGDHAGH